MNIEQRSGKWIATAYTDGWPLQGTIETTFGLDKVKFFGVDELHDLRYAIDRMIAKLERETKK